MIPFHPFISRSENDRDIKSFDLKSSPEVVHQFHLNCKSLHCINIAVRVSDMSLLGDPEDSVPEQTTVPCLVRSHEVPATTTSTSPIRQSPSVRNRVEFDSFSSPSALSPR